jgi:perosamine synthetase
MGNNLYYEEKMKRKFIPVNEPLLDGNELKYVTEAITTGWISSEGPFVKKFEQKFSSRVNRKYGVAVANGTAALEIAVKALGIGLGDEVIMPTFTIISCAGAIVKVRATSVLVDSDPYTWNMDVNQIEKKITFRTKAIMAVHIYGLTVDMNPLLEIAKKHNLLVIEDAAQAIGQTYKDRQCGSFGDISIFSFYPNKHVTTGEGGMIVTNSESLAEKCASLRNLCFKKEQRFIHDELGWNYRMTNIQAALGLAQLEQLDPHLEKKRQIGNYYLDKLNGIQNIMLPLKTTIYTNNLFWVFGILLNDPDNFMVNVIMKKLSQCGIGTRPFFWPMHEQPVFKKLGLFENEVYPVAERIARNGFYIPSGLGLSDEDVIYVVSKLTNIQLLKTD